MSSWHHLAEAAVAFPDAGSTPGRLAMTASQIGYDGIIIRNGDQVADEPSFESIEDEFGIELVSGIEVNVSDPDEVSGRLPHFREQTPLLLVGGGSERMNRFIASQRHVDVLTGPIDGHGPDINPGIATDAKDNDVAIEIDLHPLNEEGGDRVRYLDRLRRLWRVVDQYDVPYVLTMRPTSHLELVAPRELSALGELIGMEQVDVQRGLATWLDIAHEQRHLDG